MGIVCAGDRGNMMGNGVARLFAPRKAPSAPAGANPCLIGTPTPRRGCRGRAESHPACSVERSLCRGSSPLRGSDAPTPARGEGLAALMGRSYCFGWRSEGVQGASGKPPACIDRQQLCRKQIPLVGIDAPTPARIGTGRPKGRSHFSFGGERKVCKRKPAARRLQRRPAPLRTAAKPCATLVLGYALHGLRPFLALVGLRPPLVAGFVLR